ncbi:CHAT domain-containing protein [Crassisporium funariophilum]|nr:CHAT domain-containing protein [Crassisporium funariophilum]
MDVLEADDLALERQALGLLSPDNVDRHRALLDFGYALWESFRSSEEEGLLDESIAVYSEALNLCPAGHDDRALFLKHMANSLSSRFQLKQGAAQNDLEKIILCDREILTLCPPDEEASEHADACHNLAFHISLRHGLTEDPKDLEELIFYHTQALLHRPPGDTDRIKSLTNLGNAFARRFREQGKLSDLSLAIEYKQEALSLSPSGHPGRFMSLNNLAADVSARYDVLGEIKDLDQAITYHNEALSLCPPGHSFREISLYNLSVVLSSRFSNSGQIEDLNQLILYRREAASQSLAGQPLRNEFVRNLLESLFTRLKLTSSLEDLEEIIKYRDEILSAIPSQHSSWPNALNDLANAISDRFDLLGNVEDLEKLVSLRRDALKYPTSADVRCTLLNNLGNCLISYFEASRRMEDLVESIASFRQCVITCPPRHRDRFLFLNNLSNALKVRFEIYGQPEDGDEAIASFHEALAIAKPDFPFYPALESNLAIVFFTKFQQTQEIEFLNQAIELHRSALLKRPSGQPDRFVSLNNLANSLRTRYDKSRQVMDVEEAIVHYNEVENIAHKGHPILIHVWLGLGSLYLEDKDGLETFDADKSFSAYQRAANHSPAGVIQQVEAALVWITKARPQNHSSVIDGHFRLLTLLEQWLMIHPSMEAQQAFLSKIPQLLAMDTASNAIESGNLEIAVQLLEHGRAIMWSRLRGYRHPLDRLREINESLAKEFETLSLQLENHSTTIANRDSDTNHPSPAEYVDPYGLFISSDTTVQVHQQLLLLEKWNDIVTKIRSLDGFREFLQPIPFSSLREAANEGPVVVVNISRYRSDAIIVINNRPPILVPLPSVSPSHLDQLSETLQSSLVLKKASLEADAKVLHVTAKGLRETRLNDIQSVLRALWTDVVSPIVGKLQYLGFAELSRIWWCPTGQLCALPIHAAGPYDGITKGLQDLYVSSYTSTLSSLIEARNRKGGAVAHNGLLFIGQPDASLPGVAIELRRIQRILKSVHPLLNDQATPETVLSALQLYSWAHFSCHGYRDYTNIFQSSFHLHNKSELTLIDLVKARLPNADFAFLSACHSASGAVEETPDEVIHLSAAMQFSGFRSVVGTMWEIGDRDAVEVSEAFYRYLFRNGLGSKADYKDSAKGLHLAINTLRKQSGITPARWIQFIHIGV